MYKRQVTWSISPSLPAGLALDASTGEISGTPNELLIRTMFTVTGTNSGGSATAYINITIVDEVPTIEYLTNELALTNNTASNDLPLSPTLGGSGEYISWTISPSLPAGLAFDTSTGIISGTPNELLTRSMFTVKEPTLVAAQLLTSTLQLSMNLERSLTHQMPWFSPTTLQAATYRLHQPSVIREKSSHGRSVQASLMDLCSM